MDNTIMLTPKAQITPSTKNGKWILKVHPKFTTVNSKKINHSPRVKRKNDNSFFVFRCPVKNAEVPARNMNTGAQKCVIHLVKNSGTVVRSKSRGANIIASE